jgi:hypothetical protein
MKNPAEEMVTAWLQECKGLFTMNNVKVPRKGGGMGAEIDILATGKGRNIWVEVSVSANPRCNFLKEVRFESTINDYLQDFARQDKIMKVQEYLGENYEKWFVYGKLTLPKEEREKFEAALEGRGVKAVYFGTIFRDLRKLKGYRLDSPRAYVNLFEAFHNE